MKRSRIKIAFIAFITIASGKNHYYCDDNIFSAKVPLNDPTGYVDFGLHQIEQELECEFVLNEFKEIIRQ